MVDLSKGRTRVALTPAATAALVGAGVLLVAALGAALDPVAGWVAAQGWLPAQPLLDQLDRFAGWAPLWAQVLVGAVVGAAAGGLLVGQATVVELDDREVVVVQGSSRRRVARSQVGRVVLEGKHLCLRDHDDVDLVRESVDGDPDTLRAALRRLDWPLVG